MYDVGDGGACDEACTDRGGVTTTWEDMVVPVHTSCFRRRLVGRARARTCICTLLLLLGRVAARVALTPLGTQTAHVLVDVYTWWPSVCDVSIGE